MQSVAVSRLSTSARALNEIGSTSGMVKNTQMAITQHVATAELIIEAVSPRKNGPGLKSARPTVMRHTMGMMYDTYLQRRRVSHTRAQRQTAMTSLSPPPQNAQPDRGD